MDVSNLNSPIPEDQSMYQMNLSVRITRSVKHYKLLFTKNWYNKMVSFGFSISEDLSKFLVVIVLVLYLAKINLQGQKFTVVFKLI